MLPWCGVWKRRVVACVNLGMQAAQVQVRAAPTCPPHAPTCAGARWPHKLLAVVGVLVGLAKGGVGILVRPTAGFVEAGSKGLIGAGLLCLGKRGIQGKLIRR